MSKTLNFTYDNISDFYRDCEKLSDKSNELAYNGIIQKEEISFRGLSNSEILNSKFSYTKGLNDLKELDISFMNLGGGKKLYKYDELDGDDINYDRLIDGFPALKKRINSNGRGVGKFISIWVDICVHCCVEYKDMLYKSYTVMRLIDYLESMNYRVAVYSCDYTRDAYGSYDGETDVNYNLEVCIKKFEDSLNKGLILTSISPWFLRYHMFKHQTASYRTGWGLGNSAKVPRKQDKENIIIDSKDCLDETSANKKIKEITELFS